MHIQPVEAKCDYKREDCTQEICVKSDTRGVANDNQVEEFPQDDDVKCSESIDFVRDVDGGGVLGAQEAFCERRITEYPYAFFYHDTGGSDGDFRAEGKGFGE